jgi:hypothetical protein
MEGQNLRTASDYINNLLLARGLLWNGKSIDFARPACATGDTDATMARIINLVHDLVLRRDVRLLIHVTLNYWNAADERISVKPSTGKTLRRQYEHYDVGRHVRHSKSYVPMAAKSLKGWR